MAVNRLGANPEVALITHNRSKKLPKAKVLRDSDFGFRPRVLLAPDFLTVLPSIGSH